MSLYNLLFKIHPFAPVFLAVLGVDYKEVPRFRDCFLNKQGEIVIFTRTGGGNREEYAEQNEALRKIPGYKYDKNDETDCTYAHFCYDVPAEFKNIADDIIKMGFAVDMSERWQKAFDTLEKKND